MKNFPHQHAQFNKLRGTLEAIRSLDASGHDSSDDGVLGDRLALDQVHRFRGLDYGKTANLTKRIVDRLSEEHSKRTSNQGTRTAARENRKLLRYLGWIQHDGSSLTMAGQALLSSAMGSAEEMEIIQPAVAQISLSGQGSRSSHPVQHLLRLIDNVIFNSRDGMELALEAEDDSEEEYQRIEQMAKLTPQARRQQLLSSGVTEYSIANARKILPVFAETSGLIVRDNSGRYHLTSRGQRLVRPSSSRVRGRGAGTGRHQHAGAIQRPTATSDPSNIGRSRASTAESLYSRSREEQQAAAALLSERTERHQRLVRAMAWHCKNSRKSVKLFEHPASYDLVVDSGEPQPVDLIEVKTIDGDARSQVRSAIAQLVYYEYFVVTREFPDRLIIRSVVTDRDIDGELAEFLESQNVGLLVVMEENVFPRNSTGRQIANRLLSPLAR